MRGIPTFSGLLLAGALSACASWVPAHSAREVEGRSVKVVVAGKEVAIDEAVTCDDEGFVLAAQSSDCDRPERTFDARRYKVLAREDNPKATTAGYVVACVLAAIFVPAGVVAGAMLGVH